MAHQRSFDLGFALEHFNTTLEIADNSLRPANITPPDTMASYIVPPELFEAYFTFMSQQYLSGPERQGSTLDAAFWIYDILYPQNPDAVGEQRGEIRRILNDATHNGIGLPRSLEQSYVDFLVSPEPPVTRAPRPADARAGIATTPKHDAQWSLVTAGPHERSGCLEFL